jgi:hypothetical protein
VTTRKVVPYLPFYEIAKFSKLCSTRRKVYIISKFGSVWKKEKMFDLLILARPDGIVAWVGFKPTAPCASLKQDRGVVLHHVPTGPASRWLAIADVRDRDHSLSLSSNYKADNIDRSFLFPVAFSPTPRWVLLFTRH